MGKMCECLSHIQRLFNDCWLGGGSQCCQFFQESAPSVEDFFKNKIENEICVIRYSLSLLTLKMLNISFLYMRPILYSI
jgi:hypothetical protein